MKSSDMKITSELSLPSHIYDTTSLLPQLLLDKTGRRFQVSTIFLLFLLCQISFSHFCVDRTFYAIEQKLFDILFED